jgi:tetratricopeptide (TPR) repeat protein
LAPGEESESFQVWVNLSAAYALVYDFAAAERWFEKILAKDVTHAGARLMRAQLLLIRDRFVETRIAAKEAFTAFGSGAAMGADSASVFDVQMNMHFIAKCPAELILIDAEATARMGDVAGALKTLAKGKSVECVLWAAKIAAVVATDATQAKRLLGVAETARAAESRPYAEQEAVVRDLTLAKIAELEGRVLDAMDAYERLIPRLSREWGYGYLEALTRAQHAAAHAIIGAHCLLKAREGDADVTEYNEHAQNLFEFALQHAEALMEKYPFVPAGKRIAIPVLRQLAQIDRALDMIEWLLDNDVLFDHRTLGNLLVMASEFEMGGATAATRARARTILARTRGVVGDRIFAVLFNEAVKRTIVSIFPDWTPALLGEGPWPAVDEK